jgi:hypothetical protein
MRRLLLVIGHLAFMIAPDGDGGKGFVRGKRPANDGAKTRQRKPLHSRRASVRHLRHAESRLR